MVVIEIGYKYSFGWATMMPSTECETAIQPFLSDNDDRNHWRTVLSDLEADFLESRIDQVEAHEVFFQLGSCSCWVRPHQTRLTVAGGFAYPSGYSESLYGRGGLPEFDWSLLFERDKERSVWKLSPKFHSKRKLVCRVTLPNRTSIHNQAVVHISWSPGTLENPRKKAASYSAYRKLGGQWRNVASGDL